MCNRTVAHSVNLNVPWCRYTSLLQDPAQESECSRSFQPDHSHHAYVSLLSFFISTQKKWYNAGVCIRVLLCFSAPFPASWNDARLLVHFSLIAAPDSVPAVHLSRQLSASQWLSVTFTFPALFLARRLSVGWPESPGRVAHARRSNEKENKQHRMRGKMRAAWYTRNREKQKSRASEWSSTKSGISLCWI